VEFAASIPSRYATRGLAGKMILKKAAADLLPPAIIYRKKMGFPTPWTAWVKGKHLDDLEGLLSESRTLERGLFRPAALAQLFREQRAGQRDHADRIWRLLNLELWLRVFIDGESQLLDTQDVVGSSRRGSL
jgi:asparagine synthase (glutamine-hydrolysing)